MPANKNLWEMTKALLGRKLITLMHLENLDWATSVYLVYHSVPVLTVPSQQASDKGVEKKQALT